MYLNNKRHGRKSGHSYYVERKERVSIQGRGNMYIKNTQTQVRELYRKHVAIEPEILSSQDDVLILETSRQVNHLNMKIEDEIDKLKNYRDCFVQDEAARNLREQLAKKLQQSRKNPGISYKETQTNPQDSKYSKFSSPNSDNSLAYFRTMRISSASKSKSPQRTPSPKTPRSSRSPKHPRKTDRMGGGCSYDYNSVYRCDYDPNPTPSPTMSCQYSPYSCRCYEYPGAMPVPYSPNPCYQYPIYQQQTVYDMSQHVCACASCSRRATDLNTDDYLRNLPPSPKATKSRSPSPETKKKKITSQYPTAKSQRAEKRIMKVSLKKQQSKKMETPPEKAAEEKAVIKKEVKAKKKTSKDIDPEKLRLQRQYIEMYKKEHEKTAKKDSNSELDTRPTYTKLPTEANKLDATAKNLEIKTKLEEQGEDSKEDLLILQNEQEVKELDSKQLKMQDTVQKLQESRSLYQYEDEAQFDARGISRKPQQELSTSPLLCHPSCNQSCQTMPIPDFNYHSQSAVSSRQEMPSQTDQATSLRSLHKWHNNQRELEECNESKTVCITEKTEHTEVIYALPIERKHQSEPYIRSKSTIFGDFDKDYSLDAPTPVPVPQAPSSTSEVPHTSSNSNHRILSSPLNSEIEDLYSFPEHTQMSLMTESPQSENNAVEDYSNSQTIHQLEKNSTQTKPVLNSPIASNRNCYCSEDNSSRKNYVFYAPNPSNRSNQQAKERSPEVYEQSNTRKKQDFISNRSEKDSRQTKVLYSPNASNRTYQYSAESSADATQQLNSQKQLICVSPTGSEVEEISPEFSKQLSSPTQQVFNSPNATRTLLQSEESPPSSSQQMDSKKQVFYSPSASNRTYQRSAESAPEYLQPMDSRQKQANNFPIESSRIYQQSEHSSPELDSQRTQVFYSPSASNRTYNRSEDSPLDFSLQLNNSPAESNRTFNRSELNSSSRVQLMPTKTIICEKRTSSVKFEDESGPSNRISTMKSCRSCIDWERVYNSDRENLYGDFERDDSSFLLDSCRSSSTAEFTCNESNYEDNYESCNECKTEHIPPFSACPCMRDRYMILAALCKPISKS